ncbi:MAG TPA: adenylate/guanylate cyclase domain-containing protein, partial [Anaerolineales bacterium]|nr:adenylate/guanylate cyclase domain-containing protein [Anaerolineales bacterium]
MRCPGCQTENPSIARFCSNCGLSLQNRCPNCRAELAPGARFCMYCGQSLRARSPQDEARLIHLNQAAPAPLVEKARSSNLTGERRMVTVIFADVVGSTVMALQLGSETWAEVINNAFQVLTPAIYRYEGTIARLVGDSLIAFFGAPVAHEDDPQRAVRASLEMMAAMRDYSAQVEERYQIRFRMRACLNTGTVLVGPVSDDMRYEFTATAGTVNLAARIKFAAEPMTVMVTEDTARFIRPYFEILHVDDVSTEERPQRVKIYKVLSIKDQPGKARGLSGLHSSLVGREAPLEALLSQCDLVNAGLGRVSLVVGEPGIGKTRLIEEWKNQVLSGQRGSGRPPLWVDGRCVSYGGSVPYHLLNDLLHNMTGTSLNSREDEARTALNRLVNELFGNKPGEETA